MTREACHHQLNARCGIQESGRTGGSTRPLMSNQDQNAEVGLLPNFQKSPRLSRTSRKPSQLDTNNRNSGPRSGNRKDGRPSTSCAGASGATMCWRFRHTANKLYRIPYAPTKLKAKINALI